MRVYDQIFEISFQKSSMTLSSSEETISVYSICPEVSTQVVERETLVLDVMWSNRSRAYFPKILFVERANVDLEKSFLEHISRILGIVH